MAVTTVTPTGGAEIGGEATVAFVHGSGQVASDVVVEWDLDNDGDFDEDEEDVTSLMLAGEATLGRDWPSQLQGKSQPGQFKGTFRNDDNRFSIFNTASPLKQGDFDLKVGRKLRLRTSSASNPDPALIIRDRFRRSDGAVGDAPTGQTWFNSDGTTPVSTTRYQISNEQLAHQDEDATWFAVIDADVDDYYVQTTIAKMARPTTNGDQVDQGLLLRYQDASNHTFLSVESTITGSGNSETTSIVLQLVDFVAGSPTVLDSVTVPALYDNFTIGVRVDGSEVRVYWEGVHVMTETAIFGGETFVGVFAEWANNAQQPRFEDFWVWDDLPQEVEGILWTGQVSSVKPNVKRGPEKVAEVTGVGVLTRANQNKISLPPQVQGTLAGRLVGQTLVQTGLAHPPGAHQSISAGTVTTGAVPPVEDDDAFRTLRRWEAFEVGFIHELPEGYVAFDDRAFRVGATSQATFSDAEGAQFHYESIGLKDWSKEIVNRVETTVAARVPGGVTRTVRSNTTDSGVTNHVDVEMPATVNAGDLLIVVIAATVETTSQTDWNVPLWWVAGRPTTTDADGDGAIGGMRVYWSHASGTEGGTTVRFFTDPSNGGGWIAHIIQIPDGQWFGSHEKGGPTLGEIGRHRALTGSEPGTFLDGADPREISPRWGSEPSFFLAIRSAASSVSGGSIVDDTFPEGYTHGVTTFLDGVVDGADVALQTAWKGDSKNSEDPRRFTGLEDFDIYEAAVLAVRGYSGPPTELKETTLGTIKVPSSARFKQFFDDRDSQEEHNFTRTNPDAPDLFAFDADGLGSADAEAFGDTILSTYSNDRPVFSITFTANKSGSYRAQAFRRRVGDKITLIANNNSGLGVSQDFFIESIGHRFTDGATHWKCTWQLSPA